jgi:HD-GYP domain-containing protein (c-di-GMP phosphodiesterase class II)
MSDKAEIRRLEAEIALLRDEFRAVSELGMRLASGLDTSALLPAIVTEARRFTRSEAGTLYVRRGDKLAFEVAQNDALDRDHDGRIDELPRLELAIDASSLAGLAASERRTLNIEDAGRHPSFSRSSRDRFHYEVVSMLVVPLADERGVAGVLQLMNSRNESGRIVPYTERSAYLCEVLASHAATAMHVARLHEDLRRVFDSLVHYTAAAIDARDPCTAGHSARVGAYSVALARAMGSFTDEQVREIRFAAIFHDVGKLGVRECVLAKSDKVPPEEMRVIATRVQAACEAEMARAWRTSRGEEGHEAIAAARAHCDALHADLDFLERMKVPSWLEDADLVRLERIASVTWEDWQGTTHSVLNLGELEKLAVRRGNLTESERREIEHHVTLSWRFLQKIPFPPELSKVPEIAYMHHERMDGSGYPRKLKGDQILMQARLITTADVFDALTAQDRPYKKAMSPEKALAIIEHEAGLGALDHEAVAVLRRLVEKGEMMSSHRVVRDDVAFSPQRDAWR